MADVVIVCLGNSKMMEGEEGEAILNPNGGDRSDIRLPESQREYIRMMREKVPGKPIVAVITGGSAIALQDVLEAADAVIMAWYPGEQGGKALADLLFGMANPSGKLPVTFYKSVEDLPPFDDYSMQNRTYKYYTGEPLFPFGFGLSYSNFIYKSLETNKQTYQKGEDILVSVALKNDSRIAGDEVILVYAAKSSAPEEKCLVGFKRVHMEADVEMKITLSINLNNMFLWDPDSQQYFVPEGKYILKTDHQLITSCCQTEIEVE
jgi:beta-glucosidase